MSNATPGPLGVNVGQAKGALALRPIPPVSASPLSESGFLHRFLSKLLIAEPFQRLPRMLDPLAGRVLLMLVGDTHLVYAPQLRFLAHHPRHNQYAGMTRKGDNATRMIHVIWCFVAIALFRATNMTVAAIITTVMKNAAI